MSLRRQRHLHREPLELDIRNDVAVVGLPAPDGGGLNTYVRSRANPYAARSTTTMKITVNIPSFVVLMMIPSAPLWISRFIPTPLQARSFDFSGLRTLGADKLQP